jgi:hypothetical protein
VIPKIRGIGDYYLIIYNEIIYLKNDFKFSSIEISALSFGKTAFLLEVVVFFICIFDLRRLTGVKLNIFVRKFNKIIRFILNRSIF